MKDEMQNDVHTDPVLDSEMPNISEIKSFESEYPNTETVSENELDEEVVYEDENFSPQDTIKKLKEKIKRLDSEKKEYLDGWQRAKADFANLQNTVNEQKSALMKKGAEKSLVGILPALDSFDMAFANTAAWEKVDSAWRVGVEYIHSQLVEGLESAGVQVISPKKGDVFDAYIHQSVDTLSTENLAEDSTIAQTTQNGYKLGENTLRPARVVVYMYAVKNTDTLDISELNLN